MQDISFSQLPLIELMGRVLDARRLLQGQNHVTPVLSSPLLDERAGSSVFLKCESFQRGGAFKFRGAYSAMARLNSEERARGVISYSSGNHAQAVALVGKMLGIPVTVVMPNTSSELKRKATLGHGAKVVGCQPADREAVASQLQEESGAVLIPPFDHPHIIAGQGTCALELHEQAPGLDAVLVPVGGGGLISGVAIATRGVRAGCMVIGVEPELGDDAARSLRSGTLQTSDHCMSIADGARTRSLGRLTFPLIQRFVDQIVTVSEEAIAEAVRFLFFHLKMVVEPSGALGVAALLSAGARPGGRVGVIISGGNIDGAVMASILAPSV